MLFIDWTLTNTACTDSLAILIDQENNGIIIQSELASKVNKILTSGFLIKDLVFVSDQEKAPPLESSPFSHTVARSPLTPMAKSIFSNTANPIIPATTAFQARPSLSTICIDPGVSPLKSLFHTLPKNTPPIIELGHAKSSPISSPKGNKTKAVCQKRNIVAAPGLPTQCPKIKIGKSSTIGPKDHSFTYEYRRPEVGNVILKDFRKHGCCLGIILKINTDTQEAIVSFYDESTSIRLERNYKTVTNIEDNLDLPYNNRLKRELENFGYSFSSSSSHE